MISSRVSAGAKMLRPAGAAAFIVPLLIYPILEGVDVIGTYTFLNS